MDEEKVFTLEEARALLPWLREACAEAQQRVHQTHEGETDRRKALSSIRRIIQYWAETVAKLGPLPKQPFTIDFNSGEDYFCWEYPEDNIYYRHDYDAGYGGRHPIEE